MTKPQLFKLFLTALFFIAITLKAQAPSAIKKLSLSFETKQVKKNKAITFKGDIFYQSSGNMLTHYLSPAEQIIFTSAKGDGKVYDPIKNTVIPFQSSALSSNTSPVSYFINNKTGDMGLKDAGFKLKDFKTENNVQVSNYIFNDKSKPSPVATVELVHNAQNLPIYIAYKNAHGNLMRKCYYTNYMLINNISFPINITEILYEAGDSSITRTTYKNFLVNDQATSPYFDYTIPNNAKRVYL